jgi:hypothetical protein
MPNTDGAFGLRLVQTLNGSPTNFKITKYNIPSTDGSALFVGSPVKLAGTASTDGKYRDVILAGVGDTCVGFIVGFEPDFDDLNTRYRKASTQRYAYVCDDPNALMLIQGDDALSANDVGLNVSYTAESGNTTTGISTVEADVSEVDTTNTLDLNIVGLYPTPDNELGANQKLLVRWNVHQFGGLTAANTGVTAV